MDNGIATPGIDLQLEANKRLTHIIYALYGLGYFTGGTTWIAAIIINYVKRDDVNGTLLESHFTWQIRTFWWSIVWFVIAVPLMLIGIGFFILAANFIWVLYRVIKGWVDLNDNKPMYR
jgi:uncharacterized membrane protein